MMSLLRLCCVAALLWGCLIPRQRTALAPYARAATLPRSSPIRAQQWYLDHIGLPAHLPPRRAAVIIALIDAGIDGSVPQLRTQISAVVNIVAPDPIRDPDGHATHSAGIIAAAADATGMQSICPDCRLLVYKAISDHGYGSDATVARAIELATARRVAVINLSIGGAVDSPRLRRAIAAARAADIVVVAAVGNGGAHPSRRFFPAGYPGVIGVGATDQNDRVAPFSSGGPDTDLFAPGVEILSSSGGTGYRLSSGTSTAAPQVSAAAGLLRSWFPHAPATAIAAALLRSAIPIDADGRGVPAEVGLLDIAAAARVLAHEAPSISAR